MLVNDVPAPLRERLGQEGTNGVLEILERTRDESVAATMTVCADRFERRLVETSSALRLEMAGLRQEMHDGFAAVREELRGGLADVRQEMHGEVAALRQDMEGRFGAVGQEMHSGFTAARQEIAAVRQEVAATRHEIAMRHADQLKWSFVFWVGQVAVVAGLFGVLLRVIR